MTGSQARDRVAIPIRHAVVSAILAYVVLVLVAYAVFRPGYHAVAAMLGHGLSRAGGSPYSEAGGIIAYAVMAWYAWRRLHEARSPVPLRWLSRADAVVLIVAMIVIEIFDHAYGAALSAVGQGGHVQAGFENFSVAMSTPRMTAVAVALAAIASVVAAPVAEELVTRGLLFGGFAARYGIVSAAVLSGIVFGALHGDPLFFPELAVDGVILALAYAASGNLMVPILMHALGNAIWLWPLAADALATK